MDKYSNLKLLIIIADDKCFINMTHKQLTVNMFYIKKHLDHGSV